MVLSYIILFLKTIVKVFGGQSDAVRVAGSSMTDMDTLNPVVAGLLSVHLASKLCCSAPPAEPQLGGSRKIAATAIFAQQSWEYSRPSPPNCHEFRSSLCRFLSSRDGGKSASKSISSFTYPALLE